MDSLDIIDSHIHLWPKETANEDGHTWMTPDMPLSKPHIPADYCKASMQDGSASLGAIYIETDVRYESPTEDVATWAKGPLDEISFLRDIVEGRYGEEYESLLQGFVPWAPVDQPTSVLMEYLRLAEERAGPTTWQRVKGFRFLLQFISDKNKFDNLVFSHDFISNLKLLGKRDFSFDIGVDQRSGGSWQLESMAEAMKLTHKDVSEDEKVIFNINHLCKPGFSKDRSNFARWCNAVEDMSRLSKTYMKLSGAFSELPGSIGGAEEIAKYMEPWLSHIFKWFTPRRIMFGSDWPVCNLHGPTTDSSWIAWRDVVRSAMEDERYGLRSRDKDRVWHQTARIAYRLR